MKPLKDLLSDITPANERSHFDVVISSITFNSRSACQGSLFVAIVGSNSDGHDYLISAYNLGCRAAVVHKIVEVPEDMALVIVDDTSSALAMISKSWFNNPSSKLKLIGITGTNGKTTTATLLYQMFMNLGMKTGLISTVVNKIGHDSIPSTHTTPDPLTLNQLLSDMVEAGCEHVFMEVSSHAIHQKRTHGLNFSGGVFTNITHDHLDYHHTFSEYLNVKKLFFDQLPSSAFALTNLDDKNGNIMLQNSKAVRKNYALTHIADYKGLILENELSGLVMKINNQEVYTQLIGNFNALNILAVYGVSQLLGVENTKALSALSALKSVEGRFQYFSSIGQVTVVIDYAHTPDALENVLKTLGTFRKKDNQIITLVGCGGDRDKTKRPLMAKMAQKYSHQVILTSDNPRTESPAAILDDMNKGIDNQSSTPALTIEDRKQAIQAGAMLAKPGDVFLIAGKGHEKYQEIRGVKYPFDDFEMAQETFNRLKK